MKKQWETTLLFLFYYVVQQTSYKQNQHNILSITYLALISAEVI
jgi:hypothetical protein